MTIDFKLCDAFTFGKNFYGRVFRLDEEVIRLNGFDIDISLYSREGILCLVDIQFCWSDYDFELIVINERG